MDTIEIILIAVAFAVVGVRMYQKYVKKNQGKPATGRTTDSTLSYSSKDDEYEPYSKK
jgi:Tfp pilus assembly major pilin PilA